MGRLHRAAAVTLALALILSTAAAQSNVDEEEYSVYSALISQSFVRDDTKLIVLLNETSKGFGPIENAGNDSIFKEYLSPLSQSAIDDYRKKNEKISPLKRRFKFSIKYEIISRDEMEGFFKDGFPGEGFRRSWEQFYKKYPHSPGYIWLSRVGFNEKRDEALVYVASMCDQLCGGGMYVRLTKKDGNWNVQQKWSVWAS
jgi:hypothetical protein